MIRVNLTLLLQELGRARSSVYFVACGLLLRDSSSSGLMSPTTTSCSYHRRLSSQVVALPTRYLTHIRGHKMTKIWAMLLSSIQIYVLDYTAQITYPEKPKVEAVSYQGIVAVCV